MAKKKIAKKKPSPTGDQPKFEEALAELEGIVADLEGGELGLDDALAAYERGVERLKQCQAQLGAAERKIELLSGVDAEGNPITRTFEEGAEESLDAKAASRSRKRSGVDDRTSLF